MNVYNKYDHQLLESELVAELEKGIHQFFCNSQPGSVIPHIRIEISVRILDPRLLNELMNSVSANRHPLSFPTPVGPAPIVITHEGFGIRITDEPKLDHQSFVLSIKPVWGPEQLWVNEEGHKAIIRLAQNCESVAFRSERHPDDWTFSSREELLNWGFMPSFAMPRAYTAG